VLDEIEAFRYFERETRSRMNMGQLALRKAMESRYGTIEQGAYELVDRSRVARNRSVEESHES
jgi:hypothetical protein